MKKIIVALLMVLTLAVSNVGAVSYLTSTTLSSALSATATVAVLASGTNVQAGGALFIDHEFIPILSCANAACTRVNIARTNKPTTHSASAVVYVATPAAKAAAFLTSPAAQRAGQCSTSTSGNTNTALSDYQWLPIVDIDTGNVYMCRRNGVGGSWVWNVTNVLNINGTAGSVPTAWP